MAKKGHTNNPAGRPSGIPNKLTMELRSALKAVIDAELERIPELLEGLEPRERLELVIKLLRFILPVPTPLSATHGEPMDFGL